MFLGKKLFRFIAFFAVAFAPSWSWASNLSKWQSVSEKVSGDIPWYLSVSEGPAQSVENPLWVCVKGDHLLFGLDEKNKTLFGVWPVAVGRIGGQKTKVGDMRTPEGIFSVDRIDDASFWPPYRDKKTGDTVGYGPWFIRLKTTPWTGIGIHGTDDDHLDEIGTDASHGCIRMANHNLLTVVDMVKPGQTVIILP